MQEEQITFAIEASGGRPSHNGSGVSAEDTMYTLNTVEHHAVAHAFSDAAASLSAEDGPGAVGQPVYHSSKNSFHTNFTDDTVIDTLVATDYKDPPTVSEEPYYIVRRLTPTECARLQGFPTWWCDGLGTEEPTEEDIAFWTEVFETHRKVMGTSQKPKTRNQIVKWIREPHSDSAEYKMWGNGMALPCALYVMEGLRDALEEQEDDE